MIRPLISALALAVALSVGAQPQPLIVPKPKSVAISAETFRATGTRRWVVTSPTSDLRLSDVAKRVIEADCSLNDRLRQRFTKIVWGTPREIRFPEEQNAPEWAKNEEGYKLSVETNGIVILASQPQGAFYALQTLAQLQTAASARSFLCAEIEDWPTLKFRGAHWFPSASGVPMHLKLISNVLGRLKYNASVIQCEAAQWDHYPEISARNAIAKADLAKLVASCRQNYLDPIPLINTPGHAEWIFRNGNHLELAEDSETPYAYCVSNPKSYDFVETVWAECLDVFKPDYAHLGHDEVTMRGRFPNPECPRCKGETVASLFSKHATKLDQWCGAHSVKSMIWGDMLLGKGEAADATSAGTPEEAKQRRSGLPKNVTVVDWHYVPNADERSLKIFQSEGFKVIAATFCTPQNIRNFTQAAIRARAEGLLQTTWMGYFPDERALKSSLNQFAAFVLAADYAWSGRTNLPSGLGYEPKDIFLKEYSGKPLN